jgi:hypothetical protein
MVTKNESGSTLHECTCCCAVIGYYKLHIIFEGWLQRMRVAAPFMNVPVAVQSPGYYRLVIISEGWLQRMRVAAPFMNVLVAVESLVITD